MRASGIITRWLLAAACIGVFFFLIKHAPESDFMGDAACAVIGIGALIGSVSLVVPETAKPLAEFVGECFGNLIFPNARFEKPPLSYLLADRYTEETRYAEAAEEYRKILRHYPDERMAYLALISIYGLTGESKLAEKYLRRFRRRFMRHALKSRVRRDR